MRSIAQKAWGYRYTVLFVVWIVYVVNYFDRISVLTFLPYIQKDLGLTPQQVGWLGSIFFLGYAAAQIPAGLLADKIGAKKTMNIAIWFFTCVTFVTGLVRSFGTFICLRLALALGEGFHYSPAVKTIACWFPREEKSRANGFFATAWAVGPALTPIIVTWLAAEFFGGSWRPVFYCLAIPGLLGVFLISKFVADSPKEKLEQGKVTPEEYDKISSSIGVEASVSGINYSSKVFLRDPSFYFYTATYFFQLMMYWGMTTWISTFLVRQHGLDLKQMGMYAALPYLCAFIGMMAGGWLADKFFSGKPRIVCIISFLGCIPVLYLLGQVPTGRTGLLLLMLGLGGFFINFCYGVMIGFLSLRYPKEVVGRAMGVTSAIGQCGSFLSPMIAGYLVITLPGGQYDFSNVFLFWSIVAFISAVCAFFMNEAAIDPSKYEVRVDTVQNSKTLAQ